MIREGGNLNRSALLGDVERIEDGFSPTIPKAFGFEAATQSGLG
ncbi:MAG: hypothetical protein ABIF19_20490 [Planctomycetota bacterium]